jgi:hypothetical protein
MGTRLQPRERLELVEERRRAAENVLWQLPSVTIAAQAFLLSAGLDPQASDWARRIVGVLGIATVMVTASIVAFQGARIAALAMGSSG